MRLNESVRQHRREAGLTQSALADRAGLQAKHISRIETGALPSISLGTLGRLADAMGVTPADMLRGVELSDEKAG